MDIIGRVRTWCELLALVFLSRRDHTHLTYGAKEVLYVIEF